MSDILRFDDPAQVLALYRHMLARTEYAAKYHAMQADIHDKLCKESAGEIVKLRQQIEQYSAMIPAAGGV